MSMFLRKGWGVGAFLALAGVSGAADIDLVKTYGVLDANRKLVVLGTAQAFAESARKERLFDGDTATFFDADPAGANSTWAGFSTTRPVIPTRIRYAGRDGYESRAASCVFQGANKADFSDAVALHVVAPPAKWKGRDWVEVALDWSAVRGGPQAFTHFRVLGSTGRVGYDAGACCGNFSELQFFGVESLPKPAKDGSAATPASTVALVPTLVNDWENPAVSSINRLPPRTYSVPLVAVQDALSDALEPASPWTQSLNGDWKISWAGNPALRVQDFWRADFDDSLWGEVDVPSCLETRGFGSPQYTNADFPHQAKWPTIRNCDTGAADYNPVASYRRRFTVPKSWAGRRVILRFDGVYSAYYVWVNGRKIGYAEDSMLPSEFDVTDFITSGTNVLAVEAYRWSDGSFLEDQDTFRFHGIFRDVTLWSMPKDGIWDFEVKTALADDFRSATLEVLGCDGGAATLYDAAYRSVGAFTAGKGRLAIPGVHLWSAEKPYLYTLVLVKGADIRMKRVGFKRQRIDGVVFRVNGQAVKLKGVNRCETSPDNGRTVTRADMLKDIEMFKRHNIDTVRTSHYPNHRLWYDLCDRYGVYVLAEANIETHGFYKESDDPSRSPEWIAPMVERNERHVRFYRNHPSVTIWSVGNEARSGIAISNALMAVRRLDPTRPLTCNIGGVGGLTDIDGGGYTQPSWLENRARTTQKPYFFIEYAHAMGNALGTFQNYWDVFDKYDSLFGGCVWDWADQAVWKYTDRVDPKTGEPERYFGYGGDWDERPNSGNFCVNGIVDPLRHVTPKLIEVAHVHRPLVVTRRPDGSLELWNRHAFTYADDYAGAWELLADGVVVQRGAFEVPHLAPFGKCTRTAPVKAIAGKECFLNLSFTTKVDHLWAKKGWVVARNQIRLSERPQPKPAVEVGGAVRIDASDRACVRVEAGATRTTFSRRTGTLCELVMDGVTVLRDPAPGIVTGPRLSCVRAFVDNDGWMREDFIRSGLLQINYHPSQIVVAGSNVVRVTTAVDGSKSAGFRHEQTWTFHADGSIDLHSATTPHGTMPKQLPRFGLSLKLAHALENMTYYGRGPYENYVDRCTGSLFGIWRSTVAEQYVDYVRPQDNGYKGEVRWVEFRDAAGKGVRFSASEPLFVQALHYTADDLDRSRHRGPAFGVGERRFRSPLVPRDEVCLNLDIRQCGLGGASCGPRPLDEHLFPIRPEAWTVRIAPAPSADASTASLSSHR